MGLALPCACFAPSLREVRKWDYQALLKKFPFQRTLVSLLGAEWHILKRQLQVKALGQREFGEHLPETSGGARGPGGEGEGRTSVWLGGRRPRAIRVGGPLLLVQRCEGPSRSWGHRGGVRHRPKWEQR